ncbi:carbon catabolite repressor protein 4 homolog 3-like isoform X5 [Gastrolobium bilobum]|uniref:carbon catabolite repressor protein 4 homolog 3-like isoform X5 n=1 Tax=Gastrolobium bilobum TaxID=150636 RepID=UPI002AB3243D|nr:carbon catabolite repressor protein 4 homolog 3-like isoform X5 [Gastrolobium bilobum]
MNSLDGTLILSVYKRWTSILNSQTYWLKQDTEDLIRDALEIQSTVVQCFGKLISSGYWKERAFNLRTLAFVIMLLNFLFLRQMCESDSRRLLVGNIHVLYNPNRGEVKLGQIRFLLSRAQILSEKWGNTPVVLAGDFNSTPESGIYKFLSSSELNIMLYDRKELSGQKSCRPAQVLGEKKETVGPFISLDGLFKCWTDEEVKIATGDSERHFAVHPLKLNSSYATVNGSTSTRGFNGEPLATSYHSKFLGTVDYLWYSDGIVPTRVLDTVPISDLLRAGGLPCKKVGSDHLALVSEFSFSVTNNKSIEIVEAAASPGIDIEEHDSLQS